MTQQKKTYVRTLRVGESVSLDNGRIVIRLGSQRGNRAGLNLEMDPSVQIDRKPDENFRAQDVLVTPRSRA